MQIVFGVLTELQPSSILDCISLPILASADAEGSIGALILPHHPLPSIPCKRAYGVRRISTQGAVGRIRFGRWSFQTEVPTFMSAREQSRALPDAAGLLEERCEDVLHSSVLFLDVSKATYTTLSHKEANAPQSTTLPCPCPILGSVLGFCSIMSNPAST